MDSVSAAVIGVTIESCLIFLLLFKFLHKSIKVFGRQIQTLFDGRVLYLDVVNYVDFLKIFICFTSSSMFLINPFDAPSPRMHDNAWYKSILNMSAVKCSDSG